MNMYSYGPTPGETAALHAQSNAETAAIQAESAARQARSARGTELRVIDDPSQHFAGNQSFLGKYGSAIIWYAAWFSMPSPKARGHYIKSTLWFIVGAFLLFATMEPIDYGGTDRLTPPPTPYYDRFDWRWTLLCWLVGIVQLVLCIREGRRAKREHAQWKADQYAAHAAVEQYAQVAWEQEVLDIEEPAPAPAPEPTPVVVVPEPVDRPELIIPTGPGFGSRVRRGGTTLGGTPIKDRRSRDPRTIL